MARVLEPVDVDRRIGFDKLPEQRFPVVAQKLERARKDRDDLGDALFERKARFEREETTVDDRAGAGSTVLVLVEDRRAACQSNEAG